ncbi:FtsW/RodA/SpoVE family cell cycle protein [Enterococcus sp. 669A]|uniref:Probable peptidoglycan glycosyltransferase FtsW n=1 Tax=Candidatus Enterococcus moelleringii TaxID=2815325 RepID=A0ABS3L817_9ENTE|nr:FtsW/RodA/SpoVE family cell cycle protein [Enterococcus sp. 669A]MBO1305235.1 FtsW/RodA/SpoVE family cell cycle protein [Enterococcus sp. 669A]
MQQIKKIDWWILGPYAVLSTIGLLEVFSASSYRLMMTGENPRSLFYRQLIFMGISWVGLALTFSVKLPHFLKLPMAQVMLGCSALLLLMVKIHLFGVTVNGAQRWISIFGIQFQPSELANVALIFYLSYYFRHPLETKKELRAPIVVTLLLMTLILIQPKVAGAILILIIAGVLFWSSAISVDMGLLLGVAAFFLMIVTSGVVLLLGKFHLLPHLFQHVYERIAIAGNPFADFNGVGYQMSNSYYAMYNGGFFGRGIGNSITKNGYLPEAETDFIFSIIVEELGLIAAIGILFLLFLICLRLFQLSTRCRNHQAALILLGIGTLLLVQTSINVASTIGLIPMTGIPLPFISYGGTSYLILSFCIGVALNISANERRQIHAGKAQNLE